MNKILSTKPKALENDDFVDKMYAEMAADPGFKDRETIKAVHVTDVHLDTNYAPGTLAECEGFLCCREDVGYPTDDSQSAAGVWGDTHGKCDLP